MTLETNSTPPSPIAVRYWLTLASDEESALSLAANSEAEGFLIEAKDQPSLASARARLGPRPLFLWTDHPDETQISMAARDADGIAAPVAHAAHLQRLGARLAVAEAETGRRDGLLGILARIIAPAAIFGLGGLQGASPRLAGLIWEPTGFSPGARATARDLVALAAAAANTSAIDASCGADARFEADCRSSRDAGFDAHCVSDPGQIEVLKRIYARPL